MIWRDQNITCPYCGEQQSIRIDCSIDSQEYYEDCQICCRPMYIAVSVIGDGEITDLTVASENEA